MQTIQERFEALDLNKKLVVLQKTFTSVEKNLNKADRNKLQRFKDVFLLIIERFKIANPSNTPFVAFDNMIAYSESITNLLQGLLLKGLEDADRQRVIYDLDTLVETLFPLIALINITQNNSSLFQESVRTLDITKKASVDIEEIKVAAASHLVDLESYKVNGQKLSQVLANKVLGNDFQKRAAKEKNAARWWTIATGISATATVGLLVYIFIYQLDAATNNTINYSLLSTKVLITASLGLIAKWSSKRANRHLMEESKYHRLAVNMETITAFIAPLSDKEKENVLSTVAVKIFTDGTGNEASTEYETANVLDVVKDGLSKIGK